MVNKEYLSNAAKLNLILALSENKVWIWKDPWCVYFPYTDAKREQINA